MKVRRTKKFPNVRIYIALAAMVAIYLLLAGALWRLQVAQVSQFETRIKNQSLRRVRLPGVRGKIYDRTDLCLADNRPNYTIALFPEEIRCPGFSNTIDRAMTVIDGVSEITGLKPAVDRDDVIRHINGYRPLPLVLWRDISPVVMARFAEQSDHLPGVDLYVKATRHYPYSPYTSHLLGYVGDVEPVRTGAEEEHFNYNLDEMIGRSGLEKMFNPHMQGKPGEKLVQVDVGIYRHDDLAYREPEQGGDLQLTLDMEVQLLAHQAMGTNRGAVVVLDPNNGDVLAMISSPSYNSNLFVPYITSKNWKVLNEDPDKPLLNRAVAGTYPPGSTFKPLVGLAAATVNPSAVSTIHDCTGSYRVGRRIFHDWNPHGHGELDLRSALMRSANVYFFKTALDCGWEPIVEQATLVGLGSKTGVEVDYEASGLVPSAAWQKKAGHGSFTDGDICNLSIGQGFLTVTPLQMAMVTATIANGGRLYRPRLVKAYREKGQDDFVQTDVQIVRRMKWPATAMTAVRGGMHDVIMAERGTGKSAAVEGLDFAAKTGTAEYGKKSDRNKHTWMIAFAPFDRPKYAVAFLIEDGVSGGRTVGPRLKILMEGLLKKLKREGIIKETELSEYDSDSNPGGLI